MKRIAVIGGGITGVTTAYALVRHGFDVTLFERHRYAAMETSYANGGQLSASNAETWTNVPTILRALKSMWHHDAPLLVSPWPSWHKLSWFAEFVAAIPHYRANTIETARLAIAARAHLYAWAEEEGIDFHLRREGILHFYRHRAGYEHARRVTEMLREAGLERHPVTPDEMRAIEPTLHGSYYGGFYTPSDATGDIHAYTAGLADAAIRRGVSIRYGHEIHRLHHHATHITVEPAPDEGHDVETFDGVVICAGTASRRFAAQLADRVNVYPVKGYSITVQLDDEASRQAAPTVSLLDDATKLVCSRLGSHQLRVAGSAEFSGFDRDIRAARIRPLVQWVEACFPAVRTEKTVPWAGLRPMTPNMMPRVGRGRSPRVFYNTGHGHLGWTLAAATAQSIAELVGRAAQE